jgi:hypothetical protein
MPSPVRAPDWRRSVGRPPPLARAASSQQPCRTLAVLSAGGAQPVLHSRAPAAPEGDRAEVRLRVPRHRSLPSSGPDDGISRPRTTKSSHWSPAPRKRRNSCSASPKDPAWTNKFPAQRMYEGATWEDCERLACCFERGAVTAQRLENSGGVGPTIETRSPGNCAAR